MRLLQPTQAFRPSLLRQCNSFHTSARLQRSRVYDPVRNEQDFDTVLRTSTVAGHPLIMCWTASYCNSCRTAKKNLREIVEARAESEPDVGFVEVQLDAPGGGDMAELGMRFMVRQVPTVMSVWRAQVEEKHRLTDVKVMTDKDRFKGWVEAVAKDDTGRGGSGSGWFVSLFGS